MNWQIISPALGLAPATEAQAFGAAVWLWMHSPLHQNFPLHALARVLLPAIKAGQYVLLVEQTPQDLQPIAYMAWANFSAQAEARYHQCGINANIQAQDWSSGDRMWVTDWFAPTGHNLAFTRVIRNALANSTARALHHRGQSTGKRINYFRGSAISQQAAAQWWAERPLAA